MLLDPEQAVGLDAYEVRSAIDCCRHMMLALWALALLRATTPLAEPLIKKPMGSLPAVRCLLWQMWLRVCPSPATS